MARGSKSAKSSTPKEVPPATEEAKGAVAVEPVAEKPKETATPNPAAKTERTFEVAVGSLVVGAGKTLGKGESFGKGVLTDEEIEFFLGDGTIVEVD